MTYEKLAIILSTILLAANAAACGGGGSTDDTSNDDSLIVNGDVPPGTAIHGTLGTLGAAQPTASSLMISNSGETLIYLSSDPLTCDQLTVSRWLGATTAGTQVVELVFSGTPSVTTLPVPDAEVNYAPGGMSSSHELSADSGSITFTAATANTSAAGDFHAKYGSNLVTGTFHATFCANGQGF